MSKKLNPDANVFSVVIHDEDTVLLIKELTKIRSNRNAILNDALKLGVPTLYERVFGKEIKTQNKPKSDYSPSVGRELKELRHVIDDLFIEMSIIETMISGLFNAKCMQLDGNDVNAEGLRDGSLCDLPELVAGVKEDLTRSGADNE